MAKLLSSCHQDSKARRKNINSYLCDFVANSFLALFRLARLPLAGLSGLGTWAKIRYQKSLFGTSIEWNLGV
jgi:hypothetical protein